MTFLEMMEKEIISAGKLLTIKEALNLAEQDGTLSQIPKVGKTPQNTINSLLHKNIKSGDKARFIQVSLKPTKFYLKNNIGRINNGYIQNPRG